MRRRAEPSEFDRWPGPWAPTSGQPALERRLSRQLYHQSKSALDDALRKPRPLGIIAHGLGAVAVLDLARRSVPQWAALRERNGRGVLLAPPLHGAAAILRLATGRGPLFKVLRLLDGSATPSDITYQCYGDPTFTLTAAHEEEESRAASFVSAREAREEIEDVAAAASTIGNDPAERARLTARLEGIEKLIEPKWVSDGALVSARATAWSELGNRLRAIELYHDALLAGDSRAPLKSVEQLGNLLDRLGVDVVEAEKEKMNDQNARSIAAIERLLDGLESLSTEEAASRGTPRLAERCASLADLWVGKAEGLGFTPERWGLRGGRLKRAARRATNPARRRKLLRQAAAYAAGVELAQRRTGRIPVIRGSRRWDQGGRPAVRRRRT